ncbi:MAG: transposase [Desulfobaccales bacterium]
MSIREKQHRLQERNYQGEISVSFTLCIKDRVQLFKSASVVNIFINILKYQVEKSSCIIPVVCFMPDHQHLIVTGNDSNSDILLFIKQYKQKTGHWLSQNQSTARWQKDFFDHIIRKDEGLVNVARYILDNPVRKGLVANWNEYPYKEAMGCELDYILQSMF